MARGVWMCAAILWWAAPVGAQATMDLGLREQLLVADEAEVPMGLYIGAGTGLALATGAALIGFLASPTGDTFSPGVLSLATIGAPLIGGVAAILLSIAAGYDGGLSAWQRQADRRDVRITRSVVDRERAGLSNATTAVYGVGLGLMGLSALSLLPIGLADGFRSPLWLAPMIGGGLGLLTLCVAVGMDLAASAWGRFAALVMPYHGGVLVSASGRF